jgi:hypothetical protein
MSLIGSRWAVYSRLVDDWTPATVINEDGKRATLRYANFSEQLRVDLDILLLEQRLFRRLDQ